MGLGMELELDSKLTLRTMICKKIIIKISMERAGSLL